jgi:hypothetical protein
VERKDSTESSRLMQWRERISKYYPGPQKALIVQKLLMIAAGQKHLK